ncbi:MAG TPA: hypothetical protein VGG55_01395 [Candidatus Acidoferrales bacterium]
MIDKTGNWELPFLGNIVLLLLGTVLAFWMKPEQPLDALQREVAVAERTV